MKIIILSINKYREKDAIINAITEEGKVTFTAHGILSPTNANAAINNVLTVCEVTLTESKTHKLSLKESSVIFSPLISNTSLNYMAAINTICEATNKMLDEDEIHLAYPYLLLAINRLKEKEEPLFILVAYLAKLLKLTGYSFEINKCLRCGSKKDIVGFSFSEGGFICKNCYSDEQIDLTGEAMLTFRTLCGSTDFNFHNLNYDEEIMKMIIFKLIVFISDANGVYIDSPKLIINY